MNSILLIIIVSLFFSTIYFLICFCAERTRSINMAKIIRHHDQIIHMLEKYLSDTSDNKFKKYILNHNYKNVVVFGYGFLGEMVANRIESQTQCRVAYVIDRDYQKLNIPYKSCDLNSVPTERVDVVVVTACQISRELCELIEERTNAKCIMLEDVLNG